MVLNHRGNIVLELLLALGLVGLLTTSMDGFSQLNGKANEAEVKANLHNIQLGVERFAVDSEGEYPPYLIGGEVRYAAQVDPAADQPFTQITEYASRDMVSDPLLRAGYVDAYPKNPFIKHGIGVHEIQAKLDTAMMGCDPLRNGPDTEGEQGMGTRFGAMCDTMGNVFADPRYRMFIARDTATGVIASCSTWADVEYDFWDVWQGEEPRLFLPGMFLYKGAGPIPVNWRQPAGTPHPSAITSQEPNGTDLYVMAGFGGLRTKGKDIVGDERPLVYRRKGAAGQPDQELTIWAWTRSVVSLDPADVGGSPYSPSDELGSDSGYDLWYGNPNGIRDAVILVLTAGEDYIGD